jgi:tetratricopeptide (TPR) repeat protein
MREVARKLIDLKGRASTNVMPTVILGSASSLAESIERQAGVRIGMWPCISDQEPEAAMGLMAVLGNLLEQWQGVTVYRVFAKLEEEPSSYRWDIRQSQFTVDDWEFEGLNDNVGLWARLDEQGSGWKFTLELENDQLEDEEIVVLEYTTASMNDLVNTMPQVARDIATSLQLETDGYRPLHYEEANRSESDLKYLLRTMFAYERDLLLYLFGQQVDIESSFNRFHGDAARLNDEFPAWAVATETARTMLPGFGTLSDKLPEPEKLIAGFDAQGLVAALILSRALIEARQSKRAIDLLEAQTDHASQDKRLWTALVEVYSRSGRVKETIGAYQSAVEYDAVDARMLEAYAALLPLLDAQGWHVDEFVFIDPDEHGEQAITREALAALGAAMEHDPGRRAILLARQCLLIIENDPESRLWPLFDELVKADGSGEHVRSVVDELYNLEDLSPGLDILERMINRFPDRYDLHVNLAVLYILDNEGEAAVAHLEKASELTDDEEALNDIDRLMLSAEDPTFEERIGEISDKISARNALSDEEFEFLEDTVERAPAFAEVYLLLGQGYVIEDDIASAIELLVDGANDVPHDPEMLEMLARLLWQSDEKSLAFEYLNRALVHNPNHVPTLALAGQLLVEDNQPDAARLYLARAEALSPNEPALRRAKANIAKIMAQRDKGE